MRASIVFVSVGLLSVVGPAPAGASSTDGWTPPHDRVQGVLQGEGLTSPESGWNSYPWT